MDGQELTADQFLQQTDSSVMNSIQSFVQHANNLEETLGITSSWYLQNRLEIGKSSKNHQKSPKVLDFCENLETSIFPSLFKNRKLHLETYLFHFNYLNCTFTWIGSKLELLNVPNAETTLLEFSSEFLVGENWLSSERSQDWTVQSGLLFSSLLKDFIWIYGFLYP